MNEAPAVSTDFGQRVETRNLPPDEVASKILEIKESVLVKSLHLDTENSTCVHPVDIEQMFDLYDQLFFEKGCRNLMTHAPLSFRLSRRMTRAGGKTSRRGIRNLIRKIVKTEYEIAVSATLLFQTFQEDHRPVVICGIECENRLEALQRIMEHEMTHLVELLIWSKSSCSAFRFQSIANRFFGHTHHRHHLIAPREHALTKYGIKTGDKVSFQFEGRDYTGHVNHITKRATVLVEHKQGELYNNGKRYRKFYIPVGMLESIGKCGS